MFCAEHWEESRGDNESVSLLCYPTIKSNYLQKALCRLLEVFVVLANINTVKDTESVHYESLVNEYERLVHVIRDDHVNAAKSHIEDHTIQSCLINEIEAECRELIDYRLAAERWKLEIDSRSKDRIVSFGEKLSCRFVAALLQDRVSAAC
jgi:aspartate kinase